MKARVGFVSNSSSSSFWIASKGDVYLRIHELLIELNKTNVPFAEVMDECIKTMVSNSKKLHKPRTDYDDDSVPSWAEKLQEDGYTVYTGWLCSPGDGGTGVEAMLAGLPLKYESENLIIHNDGSW